MRELTNMKAIQEFFTADGGTKVTMQEMKDLSKEDRAELGKLSAEAIGAVIVQPKS